MPARKPAKPRGKPVHIHKPKLIHDWRELLVEIGVIVVGIVIALGGEQIVETMHWREQVAGAEAALKPNFIRVVDNTAEREAEAACVDDRLAYLGALVERSSETGRLPAVGPIGTPAFSPWRNAVWNGLVSGQVATHLPRDKLLAYSGIVNQSDFLANLSDQELEQWTTLGTLIGPGRRFSDAEAETLRVTLAKARFSARTMLRTSRLAVARIRDTGLLDASDFTAAQRRAERARKGAAICAPMPSRT